MDLTRKACALATQEISWTGREWSLENRAAAEYSDLKSTLALGEI